MKYREEHEKRFPSKGEALKKRWIEHQNAQKAAAEAAKAAKAAGAAAASTGAAAEESSGATVEEVKEEPKAAAKPKPAAAAKPSPSPAATSDSPAAQAEPGSDFNPLPGRVDVVDKAISTYNGGVTSKYRWAQQMLNVDVQVTLPKGTTSRQLLVVIKPKSLKVQIKG